MDQTANSYLTTRVMSASPQELRLLLLDAAIKFTHQACEGLKTKNFELSFNGFGQARDIALELVSGISEDADPELADNVRGVFLFIYRELMDASFEKSVQKTERVIELLEYERDTWILAMERITAERGGASAPGRGAGDSMGANVAAPGGVPGKNAAAANSDGSPGTSRLSIQA
jgi:flagellar secretion chaperone FliS